MKKKEEQETKWFSKQLTRLLLPLTYLHKTYLAKLTMFITVGEYCLEVCGLLEEDEGELAEEVEVYRLGWFDELEVDRSVDRNDDDADGKLDDESSKLKPDCEASE